MNMYPCMQASVASWAKTHRNINRHILSYTNIPPQKEVHLRTCKHGL